MQQNQEIIDLQSDFEVQNVIKFNQKYYFGNFSLELNNSLLKLQFEFKRHLVSTDLENEELQVIGRQQYELTKPMELLISWADLSSNIKKSFTSLKVFASFLKDKIGNPEYIEVDRQKLTIKLEEKPPIYLYFGVYKKIQKSQLIEDMKKLDNTFSKLTQEDMNLLDPDLILASSNLSQMETLKLLLDGSQDEQESSEFSNHSKEQQQNNNQNNTNPIKDIIEPDNQTAEIFGSEFKFPDQNNSYRFQGVTKQNEIPIYQRFRGFNINIPRKQKMRVAQKMLRIGYGKEQIIRFFSGGAEQMQNQDSLLPDYRNPQTTRYRQIHLLVAKRQHERHNELLRRHGLPPIQELPEYSGQITKKPTLTEERRIKEMLISHIKTKKFKKLDDIYMQMKRNGFETTLPTLRKIFEELKQKSRQKKALMKKNEHNPQPVEIN